MMSHSIKNCFYLLIAVLAVARSDEKLHVPIDESHKEAELDVLVVDSHGRPMLEPPSIRLQHLLQGTWIDAPLRKLPVRLKYGTYKLSVRHPGFLAIEKTIHIQSPAQATVIALFPARGGIWEDNTIRGRLSRFSDKPGCRWIRLISPFGGSTVGDARVSEGGYFLFENIPPGRYLAVTIGDSGVCDIFDVVISGRRVQDLLLPTPKNESGHN
jgi:hypothetical protein